MRISFIIWPTAKGEHRDVYADFENEILRYTKCDQIVSANVTLQKIFERFFFPELKFRSFYFDWPNFRRRKILFSVLPGWEYVKIFPYYLFRARLKIIYQFDTWSRDNIVNENAFRSFRINIAFLSIKGAADHFNSLKIPKFSAYWMPEAVNSHSYRFSAYKDKTIDILQYGRRWEWLHDQIVCFCEQNGIHYLYPASIPYRAKKLFNSRDDLIQALSQTKVVICVPRITTHPEECDLSTVTTRYFECMASKCLLLGFAPRDLVDLFGYNPVIEIDKHNPQEQIKYLLNNYEDYIPLIERNFHMVLTKHQWKNRISDMIDIIKLHLMDRETAQYI